MAQNYDNMAKSLLTDYAAEISQFVLNVNDVEVLENIDIEQQIVIAHRTDSTKRIRVNNHEAILHIELQLHDSTDKPMWARNAIYHGYLVGEHQLPVYSNVIYFHPNAGRNDTGVYEYSWHGYKYTLHYKVIRLIEIEGQAVLEMQAPGLLPFTPLMKPPAGMSTEQWVQECINVTRNAPVDQRTQADLLYGLYLFGGIVHDTEWFKRFMQEEFMQESKTYQYLCNKIMAKTMIENILALLELRFQAEAVSALKPSLQNVDDVPRLKELFLAAAQVQSLDAFAQMLHE